MTYISKRYLCYCIYNIKTQNGPKETAHSISSEERLMKLHNLGVIVLHREKVTANYLSALGCVTGKVQVMINISTDGTDW